MHSYVIANVGGPFRIVTRDDGWSLPLSMEDRFTRRFIWEWMNGAIAVNQNHQPRPYTAARLAQLGLEPVLVEPEVV